MDFILTYNNNEGVMIFPVVPNEAITLQRGQDNPSFDGVYGEMSSLGPLQLATFELESIFPNRRYPWMRRGSSPDGWAYVRTIETVRARQIPFRAIHLDKYGREIFNLPVSVERFDYQLDQAGDVAYRLTFREYRFAAMPYASTLPAQKEAAGQIPTVAPSPLTQVVTDSQAKAQQGSSEGGAFTRLYTEADAVKLSRLLMGEAGGIPSKVEIACVAWTVCNQVDAKGFANTLQGVMVPNHFNGLRTLKSPSQTCSTLARDVLDRWSRERAGQTNVGRVLPRDYVYFMGDGKHNYFVNRYHNGSIAYCKKHAWNYSLPSPY